MTVKMKARTGRFSAKLSALAIGTALVALPVSAFAQQDQHHHDGGGEGNGAPRQQQAQPAPRPPAPRPAPVQAIAGGNMRGMQMGGAQDRAPRGNPAGNGWQGRAPQPNFVPGQPGFQGRPGFQAQPGYQGRSAFQGQPAYQSQQRGDGGQGRSEAGGRNDGNQWHHDGNDGRHDGDQWRNNGRNDGRNDGQWRRDGHDERRDGGQWSHNWRQDQRYDWRGWRQENHDAFHVGRYYAPYRDYSYNRLSIGLYLQPLFFGSDYFINDPYYYHLPPAYGPYQWVRYYNDAVLVNTYDGQVADVIYDFFW